MKISYDDDDVPSAPPFGGSGKEIKESAELASAGHKTTGIRDPCGFSTNDDKNEIKPTSGAEAKENIGNKNPDQFVRFAKTSLEACLDRHFLLLLFWKACYRHFMEVEIKCYNQ